MTTDEMKTMFGEGKLVQIRHKARPTVVMAENGKTCKDCQHKVRQQYANAFYKCGLNRGRWTGSVNTDIRLKDPACGMFSAQETEQ